MESVGKPRRVLIIVQNLPVPFDRRVWLEATSLAKAGYGVSVICPKAKGFNQSFEILENIDIYRYSLPIDPKGTIGFILEFVWCFLRTSLISLKVALRGKGFDVIHACNPPETYWLLGLFWRLFGARFIFDHHDLSPEMFQVKFGKKDGLLCTLLLKLERLAIKTADVVITTNESQKTVAVHRGGKPAELVFIVRSGPDLGRFSKFPPESKWKKDRQYLIVYLGEICKQDGVENLVEALEILDKEHNRKDYHCVFIGDGPHYGVIKDYAERTLGKESFTFMGRITKDEELCRVLSSADIAIIPDPSNCYSDKCTMNKVMEYMFFGIPMVGYPLQENMVSAGDAAIYADPGSVRSLAEKILFLIDHPSQRAKMSALGEQRLRENLAWDHSVPILLNAYDQVFLGRKIGQSLSSTLSGKSPMTDRSVKKQY